MTLPTPLKTFLICTALFLTGCATQPNTIVKTVEVPIAIKCKIPPQDKPSLPFTELNWSTLSPEEKEDLHFLTKLMLAEIEFRKGYETKLEVAIETCNK
jgi:PBP1b-binding outer membrane lipoprotein LpoB